MVVRKRTTATRTSSRSVGLKYGFRSGLEEQIAEQLQSHGIDPKFESEVIRYTKPETEHKYTPDFPLGKFYVETKGRFLTADRQKHILLKKQRPDLDVRFVFSSSKQRISKTSKTTYADWCRKHGFLFADKVIPEAWLTELKTQGA